MSGIDQFEDPRGGLEIGTDFFVDLHAEDTDWLVEQLIAAERSDSQHRQIAEWAGSHVVALDAEVTDILAEFPKDPHGIPESPYLE